MVVDESGTPEDVLETVLFVVRQYLSRTHGGHGDVCPSVVGERKLTGASASAFRRYPATAGRRIHNSLDFIRSRMRVAARR